MMLTALDPHRLDDILETMDHALARFEQAQAAFRRIAATREHASTLQADLYKGHQQAVALAVRLGISVLEADPADGFSWDGQAVSTRTETAVFLHEIAHWQIVSPERRSVPDFGLGAGPETGLKETADAACCVNDETKEVEENLASLLGILWETQLGGPAIIAFCEQNWLELHDRPGTAELFVAVFNDLLSRGLIESDGHPVPAFVGSD